MPNTHFTKQYNKIVIAGDTLIDLSSDTIDASKALTTASFHDKNGAKINAGSIQTKDATGVSLVTNGNSASISVSPGYYATDPSKAIASASISLNDPSITNSPTVTRITAAGTDQGKIQIVSSGSATVTASVGTPGYVASISDTGNVSISNTPYLTTAESLDSALAAANIKYNTKIFRTTGTFTYEADNPATAGEILSGQVAYVNGAKITGSMTDNSSGGDVEMSDKAGIAIPPGYYDGSVKAVLDSDSYTALVAGNIRSNVEILGITGSLDPTSEVTHGVGTATPKFSATASSYTTYSPSTLISKDYFDSFRVNNIVPTEVLTSGTSGYTFTISNTF